MMNNSSYFSLSSFAAHRFDVPCLECPECKQMLQNEWFVRNYHQSQDTWRKGGYVLFDTLTYDQKNVPHISDFIDLEGKCFDYMCFNYKHVQDFVKNMRTKLASKGLDMNGSLKYFLASEYGTDPNHTHRPHYHVLFYVTNPLLDPIELSSLINECWTYGITDGVDRHGRMYVLNNTFGARYVKDPSRLNGCMHYVTKYVVKDSEFQKVIDCRVHEIVMRVLKKRYSDDRKGFLQAKSDLKRRMNQFHKQSINFGYTDTVNDEETQEAIWRDGVMPIPDKVKVKKFVPIPMYYLRKMFQQQYKLEDGSLHWTWTNEGLRWKHKMKYKSVKKVAKKFKDWQMNIPNYVTGLEESTRVLERIGFYLDGRTWEDFAKYLVFYRGRYNVEPSSKPSIGLVLNKSLINDQRVKIGKVEMVDGYVFDANGDRCVATVEQLEKEFVIDEYSFPEFHYFDKLFNLYRVTMIKRSREKEDEWKKKERERKVLKALGIKSKK